MNESEAVAFLQEKFPDAKVLAAGSGLASGGRGLAMQFDRDGHKVRNALASVHYPVTKWDLRPLIQWALGV